MLDTLKHRGPDAWGTHVHGQQGVLGHRRLSIMDPVGGDQPLYNEDRSMAIVANGEVYNYPQLRRDLEARHQFSTGNDSEAVLHHFEENASRVVHHLDGMFAFAIASDDGLFMARDPIGIKPLYYGYRHKNTPEEAICFASELKALVPWAEEVREFPPGTYYHSDVGFVPYYQVPQRQPEDRPVEDWCRSLRQTLEAAVTKRLMSDVPVGAFLSGGLDSSLIAALMRPHVDQLHTFSVGIEGSRDIEAARRVARHIDSTHHEYLFTAQDVLDKLPEIIYYLESFDQDLVRSAIPCYFCSRLAADHVKVILTGEGADELFAGYTYYRDIEDPQALHRELHRSVSQLHNINLQRVDRLTMAHGLEGRVPFLDVNLIEFAQLIPPQLKLHDDGSGRRVEKWILRQACADLLPADIVWRQKEQFDEGSGTVDLLAQVLDRATADIDYEAYIRKYPLVELRSVEECHYHRLLCAAFDQPEAVVQNVARWAQRT
jgi:asparagine synthase (glutamine-hydrolysing)